MYDGETPIRINKPKKPSKYNSPVIGAAQRLAVALRLPHIGRRNWPAYTHEGAPADADLSPEQALLRSVLACLLWEDSFYESGEEIGSRIQDLSKQCSNEFVSELAIRARTEYKLRHAPLLLLRSLCETASGSSLVSDTIQQTINRPDELMELLAIYWKDGRKPLSAQMKKGLREAFKKFDAYQLSKWKGTGPISLRDVMFLVHPKPSEEQAEVFRQLAAREAKVTKTWEARQSAGERKKTPEEKRQIWVDMLRKGELGYLALLKNLRNMADTGVDPALVNQAIVARRGAKNVLPFRYVTAAREAPQYFEALDQAFQACIADVIADENEQTVVLVDGSGSMRAPISARSSLMRWDAAAALAVLVPGPVRTFVFSNKIQEVTAPRGLKGIEAIVRACPGGGTNLGRAIDHLNRKVPYDRLIVITDEQSHDEVPPPVNLGYMINVAAYKNGVGYGAWLHIDGFSEQVLRYIAAIETEAATRA